MTVLLESLSGWSDAWALVLAHSLWVGSLVAVIVAAALRAIDGGRPDLRCGVACAGLGAVLAGSIAAWWMLRVPNFRVPVSIRWLSLALLLTVVAVPFDPVHPRGDAFIEAVEGLRQ